jgi:hypothetical protein
MNKNKFSMTLNFDLPQMSQPQRSPWISWMVRHQAQTVSCRRKSVNEQYFLNHQRNSRCRFIPRSLLCGSLRLVSGSTGGRLSSFRNFYLTRHFSCVLNVGRYRLHLLSRSLRRNSQDLTLLNRRHDSGSGGLRHCHGADAGHCPSFSSRSHGRNTGLRQTGLTGDRGGHWLDVGRGWGVSRAGAEREKVIYPYNEMKRYLARSTGDAETVGLVDVLVTGCCF